MPAALGGLAIGFGILVSGLLLLGLHQTNQQWLLPLLRTLAHPHGNFLTRAALKPLSLAAGGIAYIVAQVDHAISVSASHYMHPLARWFRGLAAFVTLTAFHAGLFARETAIGFERLTAHVIPREIGRVTRPIDRRAKRAIKIGTIAGLLGANLAKRFAHVLGHEIRPQLHHLRHATTVALPHAIGRIGARERAIERELRDSINPRLRRLAKLIGAGYLIGLIVRTLAKRFPWLFCRKVKSVGGRLCGLDQDLLNSLLLDTVLIAGGISVVEFARELQAIEGAALDIMKSTIREL